MACAGGKICDANPHLECVSKTDAVVCKRLKFVLKIIKAITTQPNVKNRQSHIYVYEVFDAIGDWSGNYNQEMIELMDKQLFPQTCQLISTFSSDEFNAFLKFLNKYLTSKWEETLNFVILELISDIYGFIVSIAPNPVAEELLTFFMQVETPPHITLIVLPAIIRNLTDEAKNSFPDSLGEVDNLQLPQVNVQQKDLHKVVGFWEYIGGYIQPNTNDWIYCVLQCVLSAHYLRLLEVNDQRKILCAMIEWGGRIGEINAEAFLLISVILLQSLYYERQQEKSSTNCEEIKTFINHIVTVSSKCENRSLRMFVMKVLQRIFEYTNEDINESLENIKNVYKIETSESEQANFNADDTIQNAVDYVKRMLSEPYDSNDGRKKIKLLIDSLQKLC